MRPEYDVEYRLVFEDGEIKRKKKPTQLFKPKRKMKVKDSKDEIVEVSVSRESDQLELDIIGDGEEAVFNYKEAKRT